MYELTDRASLVVDGTCPFVGNAQERAESLSREGYKVVILGDSGHPEVRGILGCIDGESLVVSGVDDIDPAVCRGRLGVLSQTTQSEESLAEVVAKLVLLAGEIKVYNTICRATIERQESIRSLATKVDGIVVIGGRNSANTRKLVEIAESLGVPTMWIEHPDELDWGWASGKRSLGVAAGGSTPDWLIKDLTSKLQRL
jgi:4-hydroxy-3-methylbut-2-enyl diphosphate reductase